MSVTTTQERALAHLLTSRAIAGGSGILAAGRGKLRRLFCLDNGWLVFVVSNLLEEQFDEYLVRNGILAPRDRSEIRVITTKEKKKFSTVVVEREFLPREALQRGMEGLITTLLSSSLEWPDGTFEFDSGSPDLDGETAVRLSPVRMILSHARRYPAALDAVRVRLGRPDLKPAVTDQGLRVMETIEPNEVMRYLLETCDGSAEITELQEESPGDAEETLRTMYGLFLLGVLDETVEKRRIARAARKKPLTEEELLAVVARAETFDYYGVLGLDPAAPADRVRSAYYGLARRYHPDHLRSTELEHHLPAMEGYFSKVTEAYNTLSSPELRSEYDEQLSAGTVEDEATSRERRVVLAKQNFLRARELVAKRRLGDAVQFLENAIQLDETNAVYPMELGKLLSGNPRRRDEAERYLLQATEIDPSVVEAYVGLGHLYVKTGRRDEAVRFFRQALRWQSDHPEAQKQLLELGA